MPLLLDRASISRQNGYVEPDGTIRLYFTLEQAQTKLHRSRQSARGSSGNWSTVV